MSKRISAIIRQSWYEAAKRNLAADERVAFYEACFDYEFYGEEPQRSKTGEKGLLMFDMIRAELDDDKDKIKRIQERNAANGRLGGRPTQQKVTNPLGYYETQENPSEPNETQKTPIQYNTKQNITIHAADAAVTAGGSGSLDLTFFDAQLWPRLNPNGEWNNRHRKCVAIWAECSEPKKAAITKAILSDAFAGKDNPYFYMSDFREPGPHYLDGKECEQEWKAGRSVFVVKVGNTYKQVTGSDVETYGLKWIREQKPM